MDSQRRVSLWTGSLDLEQQGLHTYSVGRRLISKEHDGVCVVSEKEAAGDGSGEGLVNMGRRMGPAGRGTRDAEFGTEETGIIR